MTQSQTFNAPTKTVIITSVILQFISPPPPPSTLVIIKLEKRWTPGTLLLLLTNAHINTEPLLDLRKVCGGSGLIMEGRGGLVGVGFTPY